MASKPQRLKVSFAQTAYALLAEIWEWNATTYGWVHADDYVNYLKSETMKLAENYTWGKFTPSKTRCFRYVTIRRKRNAHGHVAVYEIVNNEVIVLYFFHTAQDWRSRPELNG